MTKNFFQIVVLLLTFIACGQKNTSNDVPLKINPLSAGDSFFKIEVYDGQKRFYVHSDALNKDLLLRSNFLIQNSAPLPLGLKSRIVRFALDNSDILLLESPVGKEADPTVPRVGRVLSRLPIRARAEGWFGIDLSHGTNEMLLGEDWYDSEEFGKVRDVSIEGRLEVSKSFLSSASFDELHRRVQLRQTLSVLTEGQSIAGEMVFFIEPYVVNESFVKKESTDFNQAGFFEAHPLWIDNKPVVYVSRFDTSIGPIPFVLSKNTPHDLREAIMDGVMYWNQAAGFKLVEVSVANDHFNYPLPDKNIIQWVDWKSIGYAYADAQLDPLSGEVKNAQIFLSSLFDSSNDELDTIPVPVSRIAARHTRCFRPAKYRQLQALVNSLDSHELSQRIRTDYIRETVAHEVGHVLGLRHNFAASLDTNIDWNDDLGLKTRYAQNHNFVEYSTSSVMDYEAMWPTLVSGRVIAQKNSAMAYDKLAVSYLYGNADAKDIDQSSLAYCSDAQLGVELDCQTWDWGSDFSGGLQLKLNSWKKSLANDWVAKYYLAFKKNQSLIDVKISVDDSATELVLPLTSVYKGFHAKGLSFVRSRQKYRAGEIFSKLDLYIDDLFSLERLFSNSQEFFNGSDFIFSKDFYNDVKSSLKTRLEYYGRLAQWTDEQRTFIGSRLESALLELPTRVAQKDLQLWRQGFVGRSTEDREVSDLGPVHDGAMGEFFADLLAKRVSSVFLAVGESKSYALRMKTRMRVPKNVEVPFAQFSLPIRIEALKLFEAKSGLAPRWGQRQEHGVLTTIKKNYLMRLLTIQKVPALQRDTELSEEEEDLQYLLTLAQARLEDLSR